MTRIGYSGLNCVSLGRQRHGEKQGARTGQKGTDFEVADRLGRFAPLRKCNGEADHCPMNGKRKPLINKRKPLIKQRRRPHDHARTHQVERSLDRVSADRQQREGDQGRRAPTVQDAVITCNMYSGPASISRFTTPENH